MIEHAGFNSLNAMINTTGNYGFIGALAENCCMIAQCAIHQFGLPACFPPDWFAARNDQTWKLFEVFHCKLRFSEHYGEFVLGGRSLLVFAGNRCEWMASAQNDCSAYSCSRFLSTWTPVSKVAAATGNILSGSEYNYVSCLI